VPPSEQLLSKRVNCGFRTYSAYVRVMPVIDLMGRTFSSCTPGVMWMRPGDERRGHAAGAMLMKPITKSRCSSAAAATASV